MVQILPRKVFRANLDDVENLSYGKGAKKQRGTGSRFTCHRLNRDERRIFDQAKRDGFLTVRGTGYRKNRKGSPVGNTFRQRCDALGQICVMVEKRSDSDRVVIDLSTLRVPDDSSMVSFLIETVFRSNFPDIYETLTSSDGYVGNRQLGVSSRENDNVKNNEASPIVVEKTTHLPIHWETVRTKPIWGVDERILGVTCDREVARAIAVAVVKASTSTLFAGLQEEAETKTKQATDEPEAAIKSMRAVRAVEKPTRPKVCDANIILTKNCCTSVSYKDSRDFGCIDWNDI